MYIPKVSDTVTTLSKNFAEVQKMWKGGKSAKQIAAHFEIDPKITKGFIERYADYFPTR
jgi:hypothetical protein